MTKCIIKTILIILSSNSSKKKVKEFFLKNPIKIGFEGVVLIFTRDKQPEFYQIHVKYSE